MQKTNIKYLILFLSIAIGQLHAERNINKIKPEILGAELNITTILQEKPPRLRLLEQWIQTIQSNISDGAIPFIEKRNKGRFSSETLEQSIKTIKTFSETLHELITEKFTETIKNQSTRPMFKKAIATLENQKEILAKEYFFAPDKRKARDLALVVFNALIHVYIQIYNKYYPNI